MRFDATIAVLCLASPALADDLSIMSSVAVPPNIMWEVDNSGSMMDLPCTDFPNGNGIQPCFVNPPSTGGDMHVVPVSGGAASLCLSTYLETQGYSPAAIYPAPDPGFHGSGPNETFSTSAVYDVNSTSYTQRGTDATSYCTATYSDCAQISRCIYSLQVFGYFQETSRCIGTGDPLNRCGSGGVVHPACASSSRAAGASCSRSNQCGCNICASGTCRECNASNPCPNNESCDGSGICQLSASGPSTSGAQVAVGNFLNFYPPKYMVARAVLRNILGAQTNGTLVRQRMGLMVFNSSSSGGNLLAGESPPCNQLCFDDTCNSSFFSNRAALLNKIDGLSFDTNTPLGETLDDIGCYFSNGNGASCSGNGIHFGGGANNAPTCLPCQKNFVIIVTDGLPTQDGPSTANQGSGSGDQEVGGFQQSFDPENYLLPWTAKYMYTNDLDPATAGTQNLITYGISFGMFNADDPTQCAGVLLRATQNASGLCFPAKNASELKASILAVLQDIDKRSKSFAALSVQASRTQGADAADMAVFRVDSTGPNWLGHLFAFRLWDEVTDGQFSGGSSTVTNETFFLDATDTPVVFDADGNLTSRPFWDAALCLAGDVNDTMPAVAPEDPFNLNVTSCYRSADEAQGNARNILTKLNPAAPGSLDPFTLANEPALRPALGLASANLGRKSIAFLRGFDMTDVAGRGTVQPLLERNLSNLGTKSQWWKLGDIFHSSPTVVGAPTEYSAFAFGATGSAYAAFRAANAMRERALIAGANDGTLHAFQAGTARIGDNPATVAAESAANVYYDVGTGQELWAVVPNHLLPNVGKMLSCPDDASSPCTAASHAYFVDGTPQIRDAYVGSGAAQGTLANLLNPANASQWMTMMTVGDRDGGNLFTALDVTDARNPKFLWEFPQPSQLGSGATQRREAAARSWSDSFPNPAPIFAVQVRDSLAAPVYSRWVVLLNGGFSRDQTGGRGIYMVDAKTGALVWKFEYGPSDENQYMLYSFAAAVAGVPGATPGVITSLVAVDTGGQVWSFDLSTPAVVGGGALATWTGQRVFVSATASATTQAYASNPTVSGGTLTAAGYPYRPMFEISAVAYDATGQAWAFVGTGDRDLLGRPPTSYSTTLTLDSAIPGIVCNDTAPYNTQAYYNRLYALKLKRVVPTRPNNEDDLSNITASGQYGVAGQAADPTKAGWFLILRPSEKANNPADVFNKVAYFTTFEPTGSCAQSTTQNQCSAPGGVGRLYALDYVQGTPVIVGGLTSTVVSNLPPPPVTVSVSSGFGQASAIVTVGSPGTELEFAL